MLNVVMAPRTLRDGYKGIIEEYSILIDDKQTLFVTIYLADLFGIFLLYDSYQSLFLDFLHFFISAFTAFFHSQEYWAYHKN